MGKLNAELLAMVDGLRGRDRDAHYLGFFECFNQGLYFEAHEVLETLWLAGRGGPNHGFYKGLIQVAGAFVHLQKNRLPPAGSLLRLARENLREYPAVYQGLRVADALAIITQWQRLLEASNFGVNPFNMERRPMLELTAG